MPMNKSPRHSGPSRINRTPAPFAGRIGELERERARLQEEVLQLRAAVNIWTEVFRQSTHETKELPSDGMEVG